MLKFDQPFLLNLVGVKHVYSVFVRANQKVLNMNWEYEIEMAILGKIFPQSAFVFHPTVII